MDNNLKSLGDAIVKAQNNNNKLVEIEYESTPTENLEDVDEMVLDMEQLTRTSAASFRQMNNDRTSVVFDIIDKLEFSLTDDEIATGKNNLKGLADNIDKLDANVIDKLADWKTASSNQLNALKSDFGTTAQFLSNFNPNYGQTPGGEGNAFDAIVSSINSATEAIVSRGDFMNDELPG
tara:strand:- start:659 stop:1195 length:537 start_codon:yes stop_codon:yes gene_type:complete